MEPTIDPWKDLTEPLSSASLTARRVDAESPWDFFWARGHDKKRLLALRHATAASVGVQLPMLKGIECALSPEEPENRRVLYLKLQDSSLQDIFYRLCLDIVGAAATAHTESEVVARTVARTWRWHHLLRGGNDKRLSSEEQKGLIGEILVMEKLLLPSLSSKDAVSSWRGPLGAPKDFEVGAVAIEAKARRGAAAPYIAISSEHQLDRYGIARLFLHVSDISGAVSNSAEAFTVTELAARVDEQIRSDDEAAADAFVSLLEAAGFRWEDDYTEWSWIHGTDRVYEVIDGFPCLTGQSCATGVSSVHYSISLVECEPFRVEDASITACLTGGSGGD
jgi:hypothetical protein